jgi:hypothetical protein
MAANQTLGHLHQNLPPKQTLLHGAGYFISRARTIIPMEHIAVFLVNIKYMEEEDSDSNDKYSVQSEEEE